MKCKVIFKEITTIIMEIEGNDLSEIRKQAETMIDEGQIDFEKNPNDYTIDYHLSNI